MLKNVIIIIVLVSIFYSCQNNEIKRETVLDSITHIEDSIHYQIDSLSRLCDELKMNKQFVDIGDCKLYCETEGEGIPVVLINGGPGGTHHCFHPWFSEAKDFCKVIYYDQRGCGQSDFVKSGGYSFKQAIDDLEQLRKKLNIDKWVVCGYSYGGALAQYYASSYPDNVLGMFLIGSATLLHDNALNGTRQYDYITKEEEKKIDEIYDMFRSKKINFLQLLYNKEINGDWKRQNFLKPTKEELIRGALYEWVNDKGFNNVMSNSFMRYDFKNVFDKCPIPTIICEGKWDLTWTNEKAQVLKNNHPNAELVIFENSGHSIYCDEPELFFNKLEDFVSNLKQISPEEIDNWKILADSIIKPQEKLFETEQSFFKMIKEEGFEKAYEYYSDFKQNAPGKLLFSEDGMNNLGYIYLRNNEYELAIKIFEMNIEAFNNSWNVYDSAAEAYVKSGDKENAKKYYIKTLELNPENKNAQEVLKELSN